MSTIGSVNTGLELSQLVQRLARQGATANSSFPIGAGGANDSRRAEFDAKFKEAALAAGLDPKAADGLQDEIKAAITAATQKADSATDRRQVVQSAIDGALQKHGVDLEKFRNQMRSVMGGAGGPPPQGEPPSDSRRADFEATFTQAALAAGLDSKSANGLQDEIKSTIDQVLANADSQTDPRLTIQDAVDSLLEKHGVDLAKFKSQLQALTGTSQGTVPLVDEQA
jgi:hypothetical protein